jgi:hypothetical protein
VLLQASILTVLIAGTGVISLHTLYKGNPRLLIRLAAFPLGLLVAVTPWLLRNYHALGGLVPLRSNGGLEYYVSFWDGTGLALNDAIYAFHPHQNEAEARKVRDMGEIAYNAELSRQTREWIRTHPERFRELTIRRFFGFWVFPEESLWKQVIKAILSVAGWLGFLLSLKRYGASMLVLAAPLWAFPIPYYFHLVDPRYSYPAFWPLVFFSALLFTRRFTVQESD